VQIRRALHPRGANRPDAADAAAVFRRPGPWHSGCKVNSSPVIAEFPLAAVMPEYPYADPAAPPIVIVGNGPAGMQVAAGLARSLPAVPRLVYGAEVCEPYDRARLWAFLAGELRWESLATDQGGVQDPALERRLGCAVTAIDRPRRNVVDSWGRVQPYSKLILATGARPHVPRIPGITLAGVFTFRDFGDAQRLIARRARTRRTVVLGGGLFGLQVARAMRRSRIEVVVIEHSAGLMPRHLDPVAAGLLREHVEHGGIRVVLDTGVRSIYGDTRVAGVRLMSGEDIACDTIILATGLRPRVELALAAGLPVRTGIRVDDQLRTADPDIHAVGECAEHRGIVYGLAEPGLEQAQAVVGVLAGEPRVYQGSPAGLDLKVSGLSVFSAGRVAPDDLGDGDRELAFRGRGTAQYCKVVVTRGRVSGALAIGAGFDTRALQQAVLARARVRPWHRWRFLMQGRLWPGG
jgi:nitrite reductase (NADH) large subunit